MKLIQAAQGGTTTSTTLSYFSNVFQNVGLGKQTTLPALIQTALNLFVTIVIITAVVYIIYMGIKFVTAGGDSSKAGEAQKGITYAIIGIVVALGANIIVNFILNQLGFAI